MTEQTKLETVVKEDKEITKEQTSQPVYSYGPIQVESVFVNYKPDGSVNITGLYY